MNGGEMDGLMVHVIDEGLEWEYNVLVFGKHLYVV
jgi:hypothetical protein